MPNELLEEQYFEPEGPISVFADLLLRHVKNIYLEEQERDEDHMVSETHILDPTNSVQAGEEWACGRIQKIVWRAVSRKRENENAHQNAKDREMRKKGTVKDLEERLKTERSRRWRVNVMAAKNVNGHGRRKMCAVGEQLWFTCVKMLEKSC